MSLAPGTRIGPYEIVSMVGVGGMGEVYRAHDVRLKRDIALKIVPNEFATDPERLSRFQREAEVLASLNHPYIAAIYGLEDADGITALLMEFVEGEDLAQRIARGALPVDEALPLAKQIAEAIEAAHERGIIHRDLKPANIKVRKDGTVKVLDFGLAKALAPLSSTSGAVGISATITSPAMTQRGVIIGTAAYMSPEQAEGQAATQRSDIWAFGCVLYEMLTGKRAFGGDDVSETLASVLKSEPDWSALPVGTPALIWRVLRRCLQKESHRRLHAIGDARLELEEGEPSELWSGRSVSTRSARQRSLTVGGWLLATLSTALLIVPWHPWHPQPSPVPAGRFIVNPPDGIAEAHGSRNPVSISPDGQKILFVADKRVGESTVWLRPVKGTDNDARPIPHVIPSSWAWSPDSKSLAFYRNFALQRFDLNTGTVQLICDMSKALGSGLAWGPDGTILIGAAIGGIRRVPAAGGIPTEVTKPDARSNESGHNSPAFLPDGRHFLYQSLPDGSIWVGALDDSARTRLLEADSPALYAPPGWLLFIRQNTLLAQRFDPQRLRLSGEASRVAHVGSIVSDPSRFAVSSNGILVYRARVAVNRTLVWLNRRGEHAGTTQTEPAPYSSLGLMPDERAVVAATVDDSGTGTTLWRIDLERGTKIRLAGPRDSHPILSPKGDYVAWRSDRMMPSLILRKQTNGAGADEEWVRMNVPVTPLNWSKNWLVFSVTQTDTRRADLWVAPVGDIAKAHPYLETDAVEGDGRLSPDERWMAYVTTSGRGATVEVMLDRFPHAGAYRHTLSGAEGGFSPIWSDNGQQIVYKSSSGAMMAVDLQFSPDGVTPSTPRELFRHQGVGSFTMSRDGQRFLLAIAERGSETTSPITVDMNWLSLIAQ